MPVGYPILLGLLAAMAPGSAGAALTWNFPPPATPLALDILHVHNTFMAITLAIFVVVFAIMIYSIFAHRKSRGHTHAGPSTAAQVLWTTIPFLILFFIDFILMGIPAYHSVQVIGHLDGHLGAASGTRCHSRLGVSRRLPAQPAQVAASAPCPGAGRERVRRVFAAREIVSSGEAEGRARDFPGTALAVGGRTMGVSGGISLVDPLGNVVMSYGGDADAGGIRKDMARLLAYSWVG